MQYASRDKRDREAKLFKLRTVLFTSRKNYHTNDLALISVIIIWLSLSNDWLPILESVL